jgi:hypothetical protein
VFGLARVEKESQILVGNHEILAAFAEDASKFPQVFLRMSMAPTTRIRSLTPSDSPFFNPNAF